MFKSLKKDDHCVNNDFPNTFLAAQMRSITLAVQSFKLSHYKRESSASDIEKKQVKKE